MMKTRMFAVLVLLVISSMAYSAMDLTGWMKVDRYSRWSFSNPTPDSVRMDDRPRLGRQRLSRRADQHRLDHDHDAWIQRR
jgi:hypothetical protein